jgi:hypothetical protein
MLARYPTTIQRRVVIFTLTFTTMALLAPAEATGEVLFRASIKHKPTRE